MNKKTGIDAPMTKDAANTMSKDWSEADLRRLYHQYSSVLFRFIFRFTGSRESAEEILHDVFIELLSGRFIGQPLSLQTKNWLFTLAKNKSLNHIRKTSAEVTDSALAEKVQGSPEFESPHSECAVNERLEYLIQFERRLPLDLHKTWSLKKNGLDHRAIAQVLAIPVGTVKSRLSRVVQFFRKEFGIHET